MTSRPSPLLPKPRVPENHVVCIRVVSCFYAWPVAALPRTPFTTAILSLRIATLQRRNITKRSLRLQAIRSSFCWRVSQVSSAQTRAGPRRPASAGSFDSQPADEPQVLGWADHPRQLAPDSSQVEGDVSAADQAPEMQGHPTQCELSHQESHTTNAWTATCPLMPQYTVVSVAAVNDAPDSWRFFTPRNLP